MTWAGVLGFLAAFAAIVLVGAVWMGLMFMLRGFSDRIGLTEDQRDQILAAVVVAGFAGGFTYVLGHAFLSWVF